MRHLLPLYLVTVVLFGHFQREVRGEDSPSISLATHNQTQRVPSTANATVTARIKRIVLSQGDEARALANLVQLTRELPASTTSQLYYELANDYLRIGKYDQAANVLQQLLNQHVDQPVAGNALVTLLRLYSSAEATHSESRNKSGVRNKEARQGLLRYAQYSVDRALQRNRSLGDDPALTFQRAVATRLSGHSQAARGRLSRLKHNPKAGPWHTRTLAEQWLRTDRKEESPLPTVICRPTAQSPHLDGQLNEPMWRSDEPVQFSYDDRFLYLAISTSKAKGQTYKADSRPRTYDADLDGHDSLRIRLDLDRDYATCYELTVDHRGWTNDRCWLDASWNLEWFIATDSNSTHWTVEAAIPWKGLTYTTPQAGEAWAVAWDRSLPKHSSGKGASAPAEQFSLLLFE